MKTSNSLSHALSVLKYCFSEAAVTFIVFKKYSFHGFFLVYQFSWLSVYCILLISTTCSLSILLTRLNVFLLFIADFFPESFKFFSLKLRIAFPFFFYYLTTSWSHVIPDTLLLLNVRHSFLPGTCILKPPILFAPSWIIAF